MPSYPLAVPGLPVSLSLQVHEEGDSQVSQYIAEKGHWELYETQLVMERLNANSTFLDIGANIGYYTTIAASIVKNGGCIYAFEPDSDNFRLLQRNLAINNYRHVNLVEAALSNEDKVGEIYLCEGNFGDHQVYDNGEGRATRKVRFLNGAEFLQDKVSNIDFIKMDTQGAEFHILQGLMPLLKRQQTPPTMIVEFWPYGLRKAGSSADALLDLLLQLELPISTIFHEEHKLMENTEEQLRGWVKMVEQNPEDKGFVNLLVGS